MTDNRLLINATAVIDLDALRANAIFARDLSPDVKLICVIKANAYGHGAVPVARALMGIADAFAVAIVAEALELREAGITAPILLLEGFVSEDQLADIAKYDLWTVVHNKRQLKAIEANACYKITHVMIKVDTGMHRLGVMPDEVDDYVNRLKACDHVADITLATHFSMAEELDGESTHKQINIIDAVAEKHDLKVSMSNSAAIMGWPTIKRAAWSRAGFMLYGGDPYATPTQQSSQLKPVMSLLAPVISLREIAVGESVGYSHNWVAKRPSIIATIGAGYADGYPRGVESGQINAYIGGGFAPVVGNVSMDMITLDVTDIQGVDLGDSAELFGCHIKLGNVAASAGTIGYEVMASITNRVTRSYKG